jgi:hypothetical protein
MGNGCDQRLMAWRRIGAPIAPRGSIQSSMKKRTRRVLFSLRADRDARSVLEALTASATAEDESRERDEQ